jgi:hypothetical protein
VLRSEGLLKARSVLTSEGVSRSVLTSCPQGSVL